MKKFKEKVDWKEETEKEEKDITCSIQLCVEIFEPNIKHNESPRQGEGKDQVDNVTNNHHLFFLLPQFERTRIFETRQKELNKVDKGNITEDNDEVCCVVFKDIRTHTEVNPPFG